MKKYRITHIGYEKGIVPTSYSLAPQTKTIINGEEVEIRYLPTEKTIIKADQKADEDVRGERIELPQTGLTLTDHNNANKLIIDYLRAYPTASHNAVKSRKRPTFIIEELTEKANKEINIQVNRAELLTKVHTFNKEDIKRLAYQLGLVTERELQEEDISIVRSKVVMKIMDDHEKVNEALKDDLREQLDLVVDCLESGVLVKENTKGSVIVDDLGRTFVKNMLNQPATREAALKIRNDKGLEKALRVKLQQIRGGYVPEDAKQESKEYLLAEEKIKDNLPEITDYESLVDYCINSEASKTPLTRKGNCYALLVDGAYVSLRGEEPNGEPLLGKEGAKAVLTGSQRYEFEKALKIGLANLLD